MSENTEKRKSRTNWFFFIANVVAMLCLLMSYAAAIWPPSSIGYLSLFGLAYPFILLANIVFIFYWLLKKRRNAIFSTIIILIGISFLTDFFQISFEGKVKEDHQQLKVLTYNVRLFDLYNSKTGKKTRNKIFELLDREQADVICFQEFYHTDRKGYFTTRDTLLKFLPTKYYHERYTHALTGQQYFGVALFSKYPIINKGYVPFASDANNFCIYADIKVKDDTVRVYNAHLQSIRFRPEDYALVEGNKNEEELDQGSKRIARRLKLAFVKREEQVKRVAQSIEKCKFKVVLCGDFNDPPVSYTYNTFDKLLKDTFVEAGSGTGDTYIGNFPSFRIDYIMHSSEIEAISYNTLPDELSDHHAVTATLQWPKKKTS